MDFGITGQTVYPLHYFLIGALYLQFFRSKTTLQNLLMIIQKKCNATYDIYEILKKKGSIQTNKNKNYIVKYMVLSMILLWY